MYFEKVLTLMRDVNNKTTQIHIVIYSRTLPVSILIAHDHLHQETFISINLI